jgi:hypothetical protein
MRLRHAIAAVPALAAAALLAAGCGGGSPTARVANVDTSTNASAAPPSGTSSGGDRGKPQDATAFSACMRSHGVHNFPDPTSSGGINISPSTGLNPDSPTFKAAEKACRSKLHIKPPSAAQQAQMQAQALAFSACMRSHGIANFPDPQFGNGTMRLRIDAKNGLDPRSPLFQAAQKACQKLLPGSKDGATTSGGFKGK